MSGFDQVRALAQAARSAGIFLDIDGVLAPIRPRPEQAAIPPAVVALVGRLLDRYALVATVSGRSAADSRRLLHHPGLVTVGNHGLEIVAGGGVELQGDPAVLSRVQAAVRQLRGDVALAASGVRLEDKGGSVALHTRGVSDEQRAWATAIVSAQEAATAHDLAILPGRAVIDLRPPGVTKGFAVTMLVKRHGLRAALYAGDDRTDLDAFRALHELRRDGLSTVNVAVLSSEAPLGLSEAADLAIDITEVPGMLQALLRDDETAGLQEGREHERQ